MPKKIEAKVMKENLKKGWTTEEFCSYLGMTAIDFNEALESSFQDRALRDMKSQLTKNEKVRKKCTKSPKNLVIAPTLTQIPTIALPKIMNEEKKEEKTLDQLKEEVEEIRNQIASLEKERQGFATKRHDIFNSLSDEKNALIKILKEVEEKEKLISNLIEKKSECESKITEFDSSIDKERAKLDELNAKISELTIRSIFFYSDGNFEIDGERNDFDETDKLKTLISTLVSNENFEDLTIKQIRGVAKLKIYLDSLTSKYEISFEDEKVEKAFNCII